MLPKERRIPKAYFPYILKNGARRNSPHLLLYIVKNSPEMAKQSRFSFSLSKRVAKTAVLRNKLRRRGYSAVKPLLSQAVEGNLYLFVYKVGSEKLSYGELQKEIRDLTSNL